MSNSNLFTNGVKTWQNLNFETLESESIITKSISNDMGNLEIALPQAQDYESEYSEFIGSIANVSAVQRDLDTFSTVVQGSYPYVPLINDMAKTVTFQERGLYLVSMHVLPTSSFLSSEVINFRFFNESDPSTRWIECICEGGGAPGNTAGFTISGMVKKIDDIDNDFTLQLVRIAGSGTPSFFVKCMITRIK